MICNRIIIHGSFWSLSIFHFAFQFYNRCMFQTNQNQNRKAKRNTFLFGLFMTIIQIMVSILYAFLFTVSTALINISSVIITILLAVLTLAGFGLVFSSLKRLVWSGIGFTFLITALCIELYPLINAFWTKTRIQNNGLVNNFSDHTYFVVLANSHTPADQAYGNCITNAIKCALAIAVAFSSIVGRAGGLECLLVTSIGAIGFELNRQVILNLAVDSFGAYFIFTYGGFMGLALGLILKTKQDRTEGSTTGRHQFNTSSIFATTSALLGVLIIFALFPVLAYQIDSFTPFNIFNLCNGPLSVIVGMGASLLGACSVSSMINGTVIGRDLIHAPIAGGIVVGAASFFITNPAYAIVAGFTAGVVQTVIQNVIEWRHTKTKGVVSTISWSLFGIQGILGAVFATGYRNILNYNSNGFVYSSASLNYNPGYELVIALISAGMGLVFGGMIGLLLLLVTGHTIFDHFVDRTYWMNDDGITFRRVQRIQKESRANQQPIVHAPVETSEFQIKFTFSETDEVRDPYSFL